MTDSEGSSKGRYRIYLLVVAVYVLWGANFVLSKIALREIPSTLAAGMRTIVAAALLMAIFRRSWPEGHSPLLRADLPGLCTIGTFGIAVNQVCFLVGLSLTSAGHAAMVIGLTPFLVLALALYRKQEVFTGQRAAGLLVAVAGLFLLQKPSASSQSASLLGDMMIVGAGVSFAFYTVFGKDAARKHGGMAVIAVGYAAAGVFLLPVTIWLASGFNFAAVSLRAWLAFAYMTVVSSVLCYIGWAYALRRLSASRISAFSYLQPLVATLMALPMLGEPITASLVGGGGLIMAGVLLSERS